MLSSWTRREAVDPVPIFDPDSDLMTGPAMVEAPDEPVLAVDEIQGNIVPGFSSMIQHFLGLRFADQASAQRSLAWLIPSVSTLRQVNDARNVRRRAARSEMARPPSPIWTHVALSAEGLRVLGVPTDNIADGAFARGLYDDTSKALGDPTDQGSPGHVSHWRMGGTPATVPHVLVIVAADTPAWVAGRLDELKAALGEIPGPNGSGVTIVYDELGEVLTEGPGGVGHEHFGFRDGISTLAPRGRLSELPRHYLSRRYIDPAEKRARGFAKPGQPLVWPGQFVFGYWTEGDDDDPTHHGPEAQGGYPWMVNGSLLVVRRLRQNVGEFERTMAREAAVIAGKAGWAGMTAERLAALLVGRWPNGTALSVDPKAPESDPMDHRLRVNHFGFAEMAPAIRVSSDPFIELEEAVVPELKAIPETLADPSGDRCPTFAHIRKVNPRDLETDQGVSRNTLRAQMLRRGITFGPPFPTDADARAADRGDRGLLFLAYQTSISGQFEFLTRKWMNRPDGPDVGLPHPAGHDLLIGQERGAKRTATLTAPGRDSVPIEIGSDWVIPTGGGYFFSPSVTALRQMATGTLAAES
jgi:Dyp-type peroxidase family